MEQTEQFSNLLEKLRTEITNKHKVKILELYDEINALDFELIPSHLLDEYEALITLGNDILYS